MGVGVGVGDGAGTGVGVYRVVIDGVLRQVVTTPRSTPGHVQILLSYIHIMIPTTRYTYIYLINLTKHLFVQMQSLGYYSPL
jgi:hypothetical protein